MVKLGRPKTDNPKDKNVKIRFDEQTHNELSELCIEKKTTKTKVIREEVQKLIALKKGLEEIDIKEYENFYNNYDITDFENMEIEKQREKINELNGKLMDLYGLVEKIRDKYLKDEYGFDYKYCFEKGIEVTMPVDMKLYTLQKKYYELIVKLGNIRNARYNK